MAARIRVHGSCSSTKDKERAWDVSAWGLLQPQGPAPEGPVPRLPSALSRHRRPRQQNQGRRVSHPRLSQETSVRHVNAGGCGGFWVTLSEISVIQAQDLGNRFENIPQQQPGSAALCTSRTSPRHRRVRMCGDSASCYSSHLADKTQKL